MDARIELNEQAVARALASANLESAGRMRPAFADIATRLLASTQQRFRDQRGPDGSPWRKVRRGGQALRKSGRLRNSIKRAFDDRSAEVGTNLVYAKVHQFGFNGDVAVSEHPRRIKKAFGRRLRFAVWQTVRAHQRHMRVWGRPYLGFSDADEAGVLEALRAHLGKVTRWGA